MKTPICIRVLASSFFVSTIIALVLPGITSAAPSDPVASSPERFPAKSSDGPSNDGGGGNEPADNNPQDPPQDPPQGDQDNPSQCPLVQFHVADTGDIWLSTRNTFFSESVVKTEDTPECLPRIIEDLWQACANDARIAPGLRDDCVYKWLIEPRYTFDWPADFLEPRAAYPRLADVVAEPWKSTDCGNDPRCGCKFGQTWYGCRFGAEVFLDENCSQTTEPSAESLAAACDAGRYLFDCPVSLVLEKDANLEQDVQLTNFPLEPGRSDRWYWWKGSAKAPLLVYDPEHKGVITSGMHLFGHHTFGGKRLAAHSGTTEALELQGPAQQRWGDGFEAMQSLDANGDEILSDGELSALALWFDENRDGVSQAGEVKPLAEAGITGLYFKGQREELGTQSRIVDIGYRREVQGKIEYGAAVDWYADSASSAAALIQKHLMRGIVLGAPLAVPQTAEGTTSEDEPEATAALAPSVDVSGLWQWKFVASGKGAVTGDTPHGFLLFDQAGKAPNEIIGHSFSELVFAKPFSGAQHLVSVNGFSAKVSQEVGKANEAVVVLDFAFRAKDGTSLSSTAKISPADPKLMKGVTKATVGTGGKATTINYSWEARR